MTLQRIDEALSAWNGRLSAIADNLLWLQTEATYQMLTGSGGVTRLQLKGTTAARVEPALGAMRAIFERFDTLHSTIDRAAKCRENLPAIFGAEQKLAEIDQLLFGQSIELPVSDLPAAQRGLLSGTPGARRVTPEQLLNAMAGAYAAARDAVLAVEHAWEELGAGMAGVEAEILALENALQNYPEGIAIGPKTAVRHASSALRQLGERARPDPFGALEELKLNVRPLVARASGLLAEAEQAREQMRRAEAVLGEVERIHREALAAAAESELKIADRKALAPPATAEQLERLRAWLDQLERRLAEGALDTLHAGLSHWRSTADDCAARDRAAIAAHRGALSARRELRGRIEALKAKARALGVAEDGALAHLAAEAEATIAERPTRLEAAAAVVAAYARTLNAPGIGPGNGVKTP